MTELLQRYVKAKEARVRAFIVGLIIGIIVGAIIYRDASISILTGLIVGVVLAIERSRDVVRLEKIIYPGGK